MRTREEFLDQCETRLSDLEQQFEKKNEVEKAKEIDPFFQFPCATCKWRETTPTASTIRNAYCTQPLIIGYGRKYRLPNVNNYTLSYDAHTYKEYKAIPDLCGEEKYLWEPKIPWYQKLLNFIGNLV